MSATGIDTAWSPDFRTRLREELARRRGVNQRYSVRAFGEFLGVDHSTLSQVLRGIRPVPAGCVRKWASRLKLGREEIEVYAELLKIGENLYRETNASGTATLNNPGAVGLGYLRQNALESSNVEPVQELIDLITTQRAFELNSQVVQAGDQIMQVAANLRRF